MSSPQCPGCQAPLETRRLDDGIDVDFCPSCYGVWYDVSDLAVDLPLDATQASGRLCPRDGAGLLEGKVTGSEVVADRCPTCGGVWLDAGEVQKLRQALGVDNLVGKGGAQPAPPPLPKKGTTGPHPAAARPAREKAERASRRAEPRDSSSESNPDESYCPTVSHQERVYQHFQSSWPKATFVLGEFPWRVQVGDEAKTRDFIHPPFLISQEVTKEDRTWSHGVYLEPSEVWSGFGLEGAPPEPRGTAPAQPNPHKEDWASVGLWGTVAVVAALALFIFFSAAAKRRPVFSGTFAADPAAGAPAAGMPPSPDAAPNAVVTPEFDLAGARPASVRIRTVTNVDNSWLFLRFALVNAETDTATHFEREVSYYHGVDDGEAWSEGDRTDTVYLSGVRPGRYYLLIDPEFDRGASYAVEVTWDQPRIFHLFLASALLLIPFGWVYARMRSFEVSRWAESDHPMTQASDDEDDE